MNGPPLRAASANTRAPAAILRLSAVAGVDTSEQRVHESFKHLVTGAGTDHFPDRGVADQSGVISESRVPSTQRYLQPRRSRQR